MLQSAKAKRSSMHRFPAAARRGEVWKRGEIQMVSVKDR